ncbi:uncharacterized protein LOC130891604 isoform X1 [Diorhabda carinulata]|uniref:uncharacterized protein LOC130891604 isoform X1 n=1 Tax=Diorhabda carinulata TaxID=1163345 RepID=UPI0025A25CF6|nr:uncharacterized protein LOC130891604 isoform X1 [Diorhabda carinulata]
MDICKQYDNENNNMASREKGAREIGTELKKITIDGAQTSGALTCTPEVCRNARQRYAPPDLSGDAPWNQKKTYLFIGTICVFFLWMIVYSIVSTFHLV